MKNKVYTFIGLLTLLSLFLVVSGLDKTIYTSDSLIQTTNYNYTFKLGDIYQEGVLSCDENMFCEDVENSMSMQCTYVNETDFNCVGELNNTFRILTIAGYKHADGTLRDRVLDGKIFFAWEK